MDGLDAARLAQIRARQVEDANALDLTWPTSRVEDMHEDRGVLLAALDAQQQEIETLRAERGKTRGEKTDWTLEAAIEIYGGKDTSVGTIQDVIVMHCPLKPDFVAYLPVPRCEMCCEFIHASHHGENEGYCDVVSTFVRKDFGCVLFKAKG